MKIFLKKFIEILRKFGIMRKTCSHTEEQNISIHGSTDVQKMNVSRSQGVTPSRASQSNDDLIITPVIHAIPSVADTSRDDWNNRSYTISRYDSSSDYDSSSSLFDD